MRSSVALTFIALFGSVAYGFSSQPPVVDNTKKLTSTFRWRPTLLMKQPPSAVPRGGGARMSTATSSNESPSPKLSIASLWGTGGVLYILLKAIKRVLPIALEPFQEGATPLSQFELGAYIVTSLWFAYVEGYKGFQLKFSPLVVKRSFTLIPGQSKWYHFLVAPFYSMGLLYATRKRQIVSWSVTMGVAAIVAAVKRLPYPWRNIVDAGVVVGLTWGSLSILVSYVQSLWTGKFPEIDAALPETKTKQKKQ